LQTDEAKQYPREQKLEIQTMTERTTMALDPTALSAFASTLSNLPKDEITKAKKLYILNAIADFEAQRKSSKAMVITMGCMSIIPIFLIVFIPTLIAYRSGIEAGRQKILNAIEVWKDELGASYSDILSRIT
jgi:hypothetical protein